MVDKYDKKHSTRLNDPQHSRMDSCHDSSNDTSGDDSLDHRFEELVRKMGLNRPNRPKSVFDQTRKDINIRRSIVERALHAKKISSSTPMPHNRRLNFTPEGGAACSPIDAKKTTETSSVSQRSQSASNSKVATADDQSKSEKGSAIEAVVAKLVEKNENKRTLNRTVQTSNNNLLVQSVRKLARKPLAEERQTQTGDSLRRLLTRSTSCKSLPGCDGLVSRMAATNDNSTFLKTKGSVMEIFDEALKRQKSPKCSDRSRENLKAPWRVASGLDTFVGNEPQDGNLEETVDSLDDTFLPKIKPKKKDYVKKKILVGCKKGKDETSIVTKKNVKTKNQRSSIPRIDNKEESLQESVTTRKVSTTKDTSVQCFKTPELPKTPKRKEKILTSPRVVLLRDPLTNIKTQRDRTTTTKDASIQCLKTSEKTRASSRREKVSTNLKEESLTSRHQDHGTSIPQFDDIEEPPSRNTRSATSTIDKTSTLRLKSPQKTETPKNKQKSSSRRREKSEQNIAQIYDTEEPDLVSRKTSEKTETRKNEKKISKSRREEPVQDSVISSKTSVLRPRKNNLLKSAEKANVSQELIPTNEQLEADIASDESVHGIANVSLKLRKRLFDSTDSETEDVKKRNKGNRTVPEEDNIAQSAAEEEPISSQLEEAAKKTVKKSSKKKEKETKGRSETESTKKATFVAKEVTSMEDLPEGGLRKSTRERRRPPPRGSVTMFGSVHQFNLLVGVNNSHVSTSMERSSSASISSLKNSKKKTMSVSSRVASSSAFPPIVEQDEGLMDRSDKSPRKSVKTGRVSKKKRAQNKTKKVSTSSNSRINFESENPTFENENIPVSFNNKTHKTPWVSSPVEYGESDIPGVSISVTLEGNYHSSHGYMKLAPGMCKPSAVTSRHSLDFFVVEGVAEVELRSEVCRVTKSNSFTVPLGFEYCIKNTNRRSNLILFFTRSKGNSNTT